MAKLTLTDLVNLQNETTAVNAINANNALIEAAVENTLSRDGTVPNQMGNNLDMNSNQILNLPAPATATSPVRLQDVTGSASIASVPPVGTSGAVVGLLNTNNTHSGNNTFSGSNTFSGHNTFEGVTTTGATGTGKFVFATSPALAGTPTSTTASQGTNTTQIATTAFVVSEILARPIQVKTQIFTANGTYTPSSGMAYCIVEAVGGGGGGGGSTASANQGYGGGGGGAGSYSRSYLTAATVGASKAVVIGTGGAGGTSGAVAGSAGNDTTFGSTIVVGKGGGGGTPGAAASVGSGGSGGVTGTGDLTIRGQYGFYGDYVNNVTVTNYGVKGGAGGSSYFGFGGTVGFVNTAGSGGGGAGTSYGSGGGGGASINGTSSATGGAGTNGIVVITEFCKV